MTQLDPNEIAVVTYQHAVECDGLDPVLAMKKARAAAGDDGKDTRIEQLQGELAELQHRHAAAAAALHGATDTQRWAVAG
jgi:hypothetical protein